VALGALESHFHAVRMTLGQQQGTGMKFGSYPVSLVIPAYAGSGERFNAEVLVVWLYDQQKSQNTRNIVFCSI